MYLLDTTWLPFSNLMLCHIYNVLMICSDYDRYTIEEDGRVEEELYREYMELGLSSAPKITHTSSEKEALELICERPFELVITMLNMGTEQMENLAREIKSIKPAMPIIALSPSRDSRHTVPSDSKYIDYSFCWQGNPALFLAMVKLIEDSLNLEHDTNEADVQVIILVEDSVRFISSFLPQMYTCLIHQNRVSILEALNEWGRTLRMRGRPKIVLARNYEEAWKLYSKYKRNVLGVITDVSYPSSEGNEGSGLRLAKSIREDNREIPILIQSTESEHRKVAEELGTDFLWKLSDSLLNDLEEHFLKRYNFGPFIFINPETGEEIRRAVTMREVQETLKTLPIPSFRFHSMRNDFSRWLRAQSLYSLATRIKHINLGENGMSDEEVRDLLYKTIKEYRAERARGVIADFDASSYDETLLFTRIGKGSLGGKGRGLAFLAMEMKAYGLREKYPSVYLSIPRTIVITNEHFDAFLSDNELTPSMFSSMTDGEILETFLSGKISRSLEDDLLAVLNVIANPLSIRSSSLLEDSHYQPFAGVYNTSMIPNRGTMAERLSDLEKAIKTVWASTYFSTAREYLKRTSHSLEEEKMSVLIQQITGSDHGGYWYPEISGVARSLNHYPLPGHSREDGIGMLSFGFGKIVVDDGTSYGFCPAHPKATRDFCSPQTSFYALDLSSEFSPETNPDNLILSPIDDEIEKYPSSFKGIASTLNAKDGSLSESVGAAGEKIITFNGILKYDMIPLSGIINDVLKMGRAAMGEAVEIEFAVNMCAKIPEVFILQIRPTAESDGANCRVRNDEENNAIVFSKKVMGNGSVKGIRDIVSIKPEVFKREDMQSMASELESINSSIDDEYILIVAGRLGSSDRWLGIPCTWSQISKAGVMVETGLKEIQAEPSQGTHFFQNMTGLGCLYFTVNPVLGDGKIDYDKIFKMKKIGETDHFIHVRADSELSVKADGIQGLGVISEKEEL